MPNKVASTIVTAAQVPWWHRRLQTQYIGGGEGVHSESTEDRASGCHKVQWSSDKVQWSSHLSEGWGPALELITYTCFRTNIPHSRPLNHPSQKLSSEAAALLSCGRSGRP